MTQDPLVVFTPSGKRGRIPAGTTVLDAARRLGVDLDSVCGGRGICARCQITPSTGAFPTHGIEARPDALTAPNAVEARYADRRGLAPGRRLGCQAALCGDALIDVPPESQLHRQVVRKAAEARTIAMDPATRLRFVEVAEPDMHAPSGDLERLAEALKRDWGVPAVVADLPVLARLQPVLRAGRWRATVALNEDTPGGPARITGIWPGLHEGGLHGLAVDIGSTTLAVHLCDLESGAVLASAGAMNPQIRFGEDLMSRVSYAMMTEGGAARMTHAVRDGLDALVREVIAEAGLAADTVLEAVVVCNPVMHHLFLGLDPSELGQAPFALATSEAVRCGASELGLSALPDAARVYLLPSIAGHVGADAAAVALAEAPGAGRDMTLVVDVGTNAEILLGCRGRVLACSSPTGPAFEGAQISAGQRAAPGAIEAVRIDPETRAPRLRVIGCDLWSDDPGFAAAVGPRGVTGICGSGIIEAVAEMRLAGVLDASGLIGGPDAVGTDRIVPDGRTWSYVLHDATDAGGLRIAVTQADIRAIQLAKAALFAGARLLMDEMGTDRIDRVVLAGAFGAHISPRHALILGMIPDAPPDRITAAGNAAGTGARMALLSRAARREIETGVRAIVKVETALAPRFQEHFVAANAIPHRDGPGPELAALEKLPQVGYGRARSRRPRG